MSKINPERTKMPGEIWRWVWDTLGEISDEIGTEENGKYLLAYEGWGGSCVSKVFDPIKSDEKNEDSYYKFAEVHSSEVIEQWVKKYKDSYSIIDCGHESTGLYGVTWALFKEYNDRPIPKSAKKKAMGYPDIIFYYRDKPYYLECKTYNQENIGTTQRSFYFSPSQDFKVIYDTYHFIISYEMYVAGREGSKNIYKCRHWKVLSLESLSLDVKYEFNSDNKRLYSGEGGAILLAEGKV